ERAGKGRAEVTAKAAVGGPASYLLSRDQIPQLKVFQPSGDEASPVGRERQMADVPGFQPRHRQERGHLPDVNGLLLFAPLPMILGSRDEGAVRRKGAGHPKPPAVDGNSP